jgi:hypothetical protein
MIPPVVGVTFGTGDRNDPMDNGPVKTVGNAPNMQVVVYDRQDSGDLPTANGLPSTVDTSGNAITTANLVNQTTSSVPGDTSYLGNNQYLGYYLKFHNPTADLNPNNTSHLFFEKAYLSPVVINSGLVFSTFLGVTSGSTISCGGSGNTDTFRMCNVLSPVFNSGNAAATNTADPTSASCSGIAFTWSNLAGDLTAIGNKMLLQSGQMAGATVNSTSVNSAYIQSINMPGGSTAFAPRHWRIVR